MMTRPLPLLSLPALALAAALGLAVSPVSAQAPSQRDLQALMVYVQQGDQTSARAELRRLQTRYPNWTPPSDLTTLGAGGGGAVDEAPIWQAIERGDFAGARAGIAQLRAASPGWAPSNEMTALLDLNEAQARFDRAVAERRAQEAITIYRTNPQILRCDRVNNAWLVAEMHHALGQTENALATYRGVIASCPSMDIVVPTLEKANDITTVAQLDTLFTQARVSIPSAGSQFDALRARLVAGRGGAPVAAAASAPARTPAATPAPTAAATPRPAATPPSPPAPAGIPAPIPAAAPPVGAGQTALSQLPRTGDPRFEQVRRAQEAGDHATCLSASSRPRSLEVLYQRSWCAYSLDRPMEALAGFRTVAEAGMPGDIPRDARFGLTLAYLALHMTEEAARVAASTPLTREQRVEVEAIILDQRGVRAYQRGEYVPALSYFNALETLTGSLRRDLQILRAYSMLNAGRRQESFEEFTRLHAQLATDETRAGLNASRLTE